MKRIRILVIEDDEVTRDALRSLLSRAPDIDVMEALSSAEAGLFYLERESADVVVVDYSLPGMSGAAFSSLLSTQLPECAVIVHSGFLSPDDEERCMRAGAFRCVPKAAGPAALVGAIRDAVSWRAAAEQLPRNASN